MNVAAEVCLEGRSRNEADPLDRDSLRQGKVSDTPTALRGDRGTLGDDCVERLRLAAGRNRRPFDHPRRRGEAGASRSRRGSKNDMQIRKAGLLEMERRVVGEVLRREIEECEVTKPSR